MSTTSYWSKYKSCGIKPIKKECSSKGINLNLSTYDPAQQYINLKIIQNTVRVPSTLYSADLSALNVYQTRPKNVVNWNQMSDRLNRHIQINTVADGSFYHSSSTHSTITRCAPNAGCPGGSGVDIKHNSYARRLLQLKGKSSARLGVVSSKFGTPIPFSCGLPIYGGKTLKTNIVANNKCLCPNGSSVNPLYNVFAKPAFLGSICSLPVGSSVYVINPDNNGYSQAIISAIVSNGLFAVLIQTGKFEGQTINVGCDNLLLYNPINTSGCNFGSLTAIKNVIDGTSTTKTNISLDGRTIDDCVLLSEFATLTSIEKLVPNFYISPLLGNPVSNDPANPSA